MHWSQQNIEILNVTHPRISLTTLHTLLWLPLERFPILWNFIHLKVDMEGFPSIYYLTIVKHKIIIKATVKIMRKQTDFAIQVKRERTKLLEKSTRIDKEHYIFTYFCLTAKKSTINLESAKFTIAGAQVFPNLRLHSKQTHKCFLTISHRELTQKNHKEKILTLFLFAFVCSNNRVGFHLSHIEYLYTK